MKRQNPELPQFIAARDVRRALGGICSATLNRLIEDGVLPKPLRPRRNLMLFELSALLAAVQRLRDGL